jgi:hypothetical protein
VPNRRRRKLSTAMSAVAALAVTSPFAVIAVSELSAPAPQHHEFVQAAVITDLPNELISALSQGLSQFGINLPPLPTGLSPSGAQPISAGPALTTPGLIPGLGTSPLTSPSLTPALTNPLTTPGLTTPPAAAPLTGAALTDPALTPGLTAATPGLTIPPAGTPNPALTAPGALPATTPGLGLPTEQPISAPIGLDPAAGTYPILGDPSLAAPVSTGGGGLISDLSSAAQQLGVGQVVDLLKGVVMPSIMSAAQSAAPAAAAPAAAVPAA